ncbi:HD-GYP domain-containing protein [Brevibacillus laterosporus]|uniref:Phosphohydrolase n=1 Tax=Brevibacillus laterosporus TaxID=1465 RepID=A0AAP8U3T5_BRELA|nr:HD domain-containing phosphohydrolase [Brevibacillus laterosporus]MCR8981875.1 phosphohydrolase [Brevibacillus laterosporus]MCZ0809030.1 phosphohydrolase [Brevibacillus laterosporus]MCZ0827457.1 phosphohydrolase [Brevibacillus laterosporus]MCZ0851496.1 phosphohydrolase [Brevibacillus laterosporus]MED1666838.1 HD domain-containing phosphohydrolase [Brevibacillus laterosporus]
MKFEQEKLAKQMMRYAVYLASLFLTFTLLAHGLEQKDIWIPSFLSWLFYLCVCWGVYLLYCMYEQSYSYSDWMVSFCVLFLFLFVLLAPPLSTIKMGCLVLAYPLLLSMTRQGKVMHTGSIIYIVVVMMSLSWQAYMGHVEKAFSVILPVMVFAIVGYLLAILWLRLFTMQEHRMREEQERNHLATLYRMLYAFVPTVERKSQTSSRQIEEMRSLLKRTISLLKRPIDVQDWELQCLSLIHFVSKIKWPDYLFEKKEKLTAYEYEMVQKHCMIAKELLDDLPQYQRIIETMRYHHERYDGSGYPKQWKGDKIPLLSQVVGAVETYLAMIEPRPYRNAFSTEEALKELQLLKDQSFRADVIDALFQAVVGQELERE